MIRVVDYDREEQKALSTFTNRIIEAFHPVDFMLQGYPTRVTDDAQLWRYHDVMHEEEPVAWIVSHVLGHALTAEEFELFKRVTVMVDEFSIKTFNRRHEATRSLLNALQLLRIVKALTGDKRPPIMEIGPGSGYLGMLLVLEGYPYICTEVAQAFYLYQNAMFGLVADNFIDLASDNRGLDDIVTPAPGTVIQVPWWKWVNFYPMNFTVGLVTCNQMLNEMHVLSRAYLMTMIGRTLDKTGVVAFAGWGSMRHNTVSKVEDCTATFESAGFHGHGGNECVCYTRKSHDPVTEWKKLNAYASTLKFTHYYKEIDAFLNDYFDSEPTRSIDAKFFDFLRGDWLTTAAGSEAMRG